jgi:hypothetical protein
MNKTIRQILATFWGGAQRMLPGWAPKHVDRFKQARITRFAGIAARGPTKLGWKRFYRENYGHPAFPEEMGREQRRENLKGWYRERH